MELLDPTSWFAAAGGGGGLLGFVAGQVRARSRKLSMLEAEVQACRQRDARMVVIEAGFRMVVGELVREKPNSSVLQMCGDLLNRRLGPTPEGVDGFEDLLRELDKTDRMGGGDGVEADGKRSRPA